MRPSKTGGKAEGRYSSMLYLPSASGVTFENPVAPCQVIKVQIFDISYGPLARCSGCSLREQPTETVFPSFLVYAYHSACLS